MTNKNFRILFQIKQLIIIFIYRFTKFKLYYLFSIIYYLIKPKLFHQIHKNINEENEVVKIQLFKKLIAFNSFSFYAFLCIKNIYPFAVRDYFFFDAMTLYHKDFFSFMCITFYLIISFYFIYHSF